jgi:hypothetical protein
MYSYICFDRFGGVTYESASDQHPLAPAKFWAESMLLAPDCVTAAVCQNGVAVWRKFSGKNWSKA